LILFEFILNSDDDDDLSGTIKMIVPVLKILQKFFVGSLDLGAAQKTESHSRSQIWCLQTIDDVPN